MTPDQREELWSLGLGLEQYAAALADMRDQLKRIEALAKWDEPCLLEPLLRAERARMKKLEWALDMGGKALINLSKERPEKRPKPTALPAALTILAVWSGNYDPESAELTYRPPTGKRLRRLLLEATRELEMLEGRCG